MAGNGPAPSPNRRRRNADTYADVQTKVQAAPSSDLRGPGLAEATCNASLDWDPQIRALVSRWWDTWRRSPLAVAFLNTDWSRLAMLAPLVASYYARPHYTKLAEIRQSESLLGATHVDRLKARIRVEATAPETDAVPAEVAILDEYRSALGA